MAFRFLPWRLFAAAILSTWTSLGWTQTLALTFDDGFNPTKHPQAVQWNAQILASLQNDKIQSALFPSLASMGGTDGLVLVAPWSQAGHLIGNHTASHKSLADPAITLEQFIADVLVAEAAFKQFPTFTPLFRFPYLKEGDTQAKRDGFRQWMAEHGYKNALVSIDASDWYYSRVFAAHVEAGDSTKAERLKEQYVLHLLDRAAYYEQLAQEVLGRSPAHVILLHTNQLNAAALPDVIAAFTAKGWTITSAEAAFQDPLYAQAPDTLPAGESIIWALAKAQNIPNLRYPAEDSAYEEPLLKEAGLLP